MPVSTPTSEPSEAPKPAEGYALAAAFDDEVEGLINIRFDNNTSEAAEPYIMIAAYKNIGGADVLVDFNDETVTIGKTSYSELTAPVPDGEYDYIKVFAWKDIDGLIPLTPAVSLQK